MSYPNNIDIENHSEVIRQFSSLSANVALLRMVKQLTLDSIRFW